MGSGFKGFKVWGGPAGDRSPRRCALRDRTPEQAEPWALEPPLPRRLCGLRRDTLEQIADPATLRRGADYRSAGRVYLQRRSLLVLRAQVKGQRTYQVELYLPKPGAQRGGPGGAWGADGVPVGSCTCPAGRLHRFCKHCVAAALCWLLTPEEEAALGLCGEEGLAALGAMLDQGAAAAVLRLCEQALQVLEDLVAPDLSEAELAPVVRRLEDLHRLAARAGPVDQAALAEKLLAWELRSEHGVFRGAAAAYAEVLGAAGLTRYRELAQAAWAAGGGGRRRARLSYIMDTLRFLPGALGPVGDGGRW